LQERQDNPQVPASIPLVANDHPTINELILVYLKHAAGYYKPNHGENTEAGCADDALKVVQECGYGREPGDAFRPRDLKRVRDAMIAKGWSRNYVNAQVNRVKRMFSHAVGEDLVPGTVYYALLTVKGLRKGTPGVRDTKKVRPVPLHDLKAVLARAHSVLRAMLLFAYHTGARPGEVCALKPRHLERSKKVWVYNVPPEANKTEVHEQDRKIYVGPRARRVLKPWLRGVAQEDWVFSPIRAEMVRQDKRRINRKTTLYPSHVIRLGTKKKTNPGRPKRDHYDSTTFRRAVQRLCISAKIPAWTPNRLRHNAATRFRKKYGIETACILLGHRKLNTTEIYAEPNTRRAREAAMNLG